jgi:dihydroxy-acid dehydratase
MKFSAAEPRLLSHEGAAVVFEDIHDLADRVDDPGLEIDADSVMVLRNAGPVGGPGMPEWGHLPIPAKLLRQGVTDLLRISDARMSGTSYGAVVLHVAPESAIGGPLALIETGDRIRIDVPARTLDVLLERSELERRRAAWTPPAREQRGYRRLYTDHVTQANEGCDLDFLRGHSPIITDAVTYL